MLDATAVAHLKDISRILSAKTKSQMCLEATCGEKGLGTRLEDRAVPHAWTFAPQLRLRQELGSRACNPRRRGWTTMAKSTRRRTSLRHLTRQWTGRSTRIASRWLRRRCSAAPVARQRRRPARTMTMTGKRALLRTRTSLRTRQRCSVRFPARRCATASSSSSFMSESRGTRGTTGKPPSIHPHPPHFVLSDFYEACIAASACASLLLLQRSI